MAILIASDFHCKYQKATWMDTEEGEIHCAEVSHEDIEEVSRKLMNNPG